MINELNNKLCGQQNTTSTPKFISKSKNKCQRNKSKSKKKQISPKLSNSENDHIIKLDKITSFYKTSNLSNDSLSSLSSNNSTTLSSSNNNNSNSSLTLKYLNNDYSPYMKNSNSSSIFTNLIPSPIQTNFLRPNMKFIGYQISGYKRYQVSVTLNTVSLTKPNTIITNFNPNLSGVLTINGLTSQHPTISTYFESYVVDFTNLSLLSSSWLGSEELASYRASISTDINHWSALDSCTAPNSMSHKNYLKNRYIFMRWKERFLVPNNEEKINGASFEGFYYIIHDQILGNLKGFYYHKDAEKFQELDLMPCQGDNSNTDNNFGSFEFA